MKRIFNLFCALSFAFAAGAQSGNPTMPLSDKKASITPDAISLKETEYDFGKIPQGKPVTHIFQFTNKGDNLLILNNVQASCGCTTPEWSKDTLVSGASSKITVGYNAANDGPFTKYITITYNGTLNKQIIIKGEVWKTPSTSAPENLGLSSLKNQ